MRLNCIFKLRLLLAAVAVVGAVLSVRGEDKKDRPLILRGEVVESEQRVPLKGIKVILLDSAYNEIDTVTSGKEDKFVIHISGVEPAVFQFRIPRKAARYYLSFEHEKYNPLIKTVEIGHIGSREQKRDLGKIELVRAPRQLGEVTVTATKVKFYNKGDTLVYNADAFELAEGSMLDALVAQLPGVEIRENGQIFVNGKFVENLILNGKDFFKGNSNIMLRNLGAYMVKDVAVYEKAGDLSKFMGEDMGDKSYVMDVRLKKEYRQGWIANVEAGGGTNSRYLARLFGLRYTDFTRIGIFANINNLSDNGRQGESGGFDPTRAMTGSRRHQNAGLSYNASTRNDKVESSGHIIWAHTRGIDQQETSRTNFLPGGDNYSYRFSTGKTDSYMLRAITGTTFNFSDELMMKATASGDYSSFDNKYDNIEATFNSELTEATRNLLDSLYIADNPAIKEMVNRIATRTNRKGHNFLMNLRVTENIKIPFTSDMLQIWAAGKYDENRTHSNDLYRINTGIDPTPSFNQGQWSDTKPNRGYEINAGAKYTYRGKGFIFIPNYEFRHKRKVKNQLTHIMDNLADIGVYGLTPPDEALYSADDSYWSTTSLNSHEITAQYRRGTKFFNQIRLEGGVNFTGENLWYNRFNRPFKKSRHSVIPIVKEAVLLKEFGEIMTQYGPMGKNQVVLSYSLDGLTPDLEWLLPITDSTDPMNIYEGAESLKNQLNHRWELSWEWTSGQRPLNHTLTLNYNLQSNTLVRGYTYDTHTGVRHIRSYNTSGNWTEGASSYLSLQFGPKRKMTLSNNAGVTYGHATDMIGTDVERPAQSTIRNLYLTEGLNLTWQVGRQNLGLKANAVWRHTTGDREGFQEINSATINYGLTGVFRLPLGFGLSTDLTMYMREGYNMPGLDKTDLVWNARLSRPLDNGRWVLMVDGFDLLHQLSNVTYAENAQGRTVTYINSLPRYVLFHAIYRIDIKPRKR